MKRIALSLLAMTTFFLVGWVTLSIIRVQRPPMPAEWSMLRRGMTPAQVRGALPTEVHDLRAAHGFDLTMQNNEHGHWQLMVHYDATGGVVSAEAKYIHTAGRGLLSTRGRTVL